MSWTRTRSSEHGAIVPRRELLGGRCLGLESFAPEPDGRDQDHRKHVPDGIARDPETKSDCDRKSDPYENDRHSCKCANTPPSIGQHPGGPEASDPSDEVRAASAPTPLLPPSLVSECGSVLSGLSHPGTGALHFSGLEAYTSSVCGGRCTPIPLLAVDDLGVPGGISTRHTTPRT